MIVGFLKAMPVVMALAVCSGQQAQGQLHRGAGSFVYNDYRPLSDKPVKVWYYIPSDDPSDLTVVFVMHGMSRTAQGYRDNWKILADKHQLLIIAPEFSKELYPDSRSYNLGNMFDENGDPIDETKWSYSIIEPLFDHVKKVTGGTQKSYVMFGHSAGAQFAHRFLFFKPENRAHLVVSANAGWYTIPDPNIDFPYGLKNTPATLENLRKAFHKKMIIQLGEADNDPNHKSLRRTEEAMLQGMHRFERGQHFFRRSIGIAEQINTELHWEIRTVPKAGHRSLEMAGPAATYILGAN